jgi:superfamily II DNA or RNA helicase
MFPSDAESIELRRCSAEAQAAKVTPQKDGEGVFGTYAVGSMQWQSPYMVEIRELSGTFNSCSCGDYEMNRLGTCKHIERTLQYLAQRSTKRDLAAASSNGSPFYELFMDVTCYPPQLRLRRPQKPNDLVECRIGVFFDTNGLALGGAVDAYHSVIGSMARFTAAQKKRVRVSRHIQPWLDRLAREASLRKAKADYLKDVQQQKRSSNPLTVPLYPYQYDGMMHLAFTGRAILADEMGLGKTVQAIAAAELLRQLGRVKRVLVVCPASLKTEWEEQYQFFTARKASLLYGLRKVRLEHYAEKPPFLVVNYEQARADVDDINRLYMPDLTILDEAQRIKNWPTKTAKTIKRIQSPYAFVLTGTPMENRIEELYSLAEFVNPHIFGSLFRFQREFMEPSAEGAVVPKNLNELHRRISEVMLRRRKHDVEDDLPERTDKNFFVPMSKEQLGRYQDFEYQANILLNIMKQRPLRKEELDRLQILLGCMRMMCDTPFIMDPDCRVCPKLEELENVLDELLSDGDVKVIIFSEWVKMLSLVQDLLAEKGIGYALHVGHIPQQKRRVEINRFKQDPDCRVFLSSESGGSGLNLQAASVVINLDLPWNPAKLEQRIARAWRKNQQRHVQVINLVSENTIEHAMLAKLAYKQNLSDAVLDGKTLPEADRDYKTFVQRLTELMGQAGSAPVKSDDTSTEKHNIVPLLGGGRGGFSDVLAPNAAALVAPAKKDGGSDDIIRARWPDRLLSVMRHRQRGSVLAVVRSRDDATVIREAMRTEAPSEEPVTVIDADTAELLQMLQKQGLVQLSPELETLFGERTSATTPRTVINQDRARTHWKTATRAVKAAEALLAADLADMAQPHVETAVKTGMECLRLLNGSKSTDSLKEPFDADAYGAHADLALVLHKQLTTQEADHAPASELSGLFSRIENILIHV